MPARPFLAPVKVVKASHAEYAGTATHAYHALFPTKAARTTQNQVQYVMSHIHSVKPLASKSSPERFKSPLSMVGRPMRSNQNSMRRAGRLRMNQAKRLRDEKTKWIRKKRVFMPREIRCMRLRMAVLRAARVLRAFYCGLSVC